MKNRVLIVEDDVTLEPFWRRALKRADPRSELVWAYSERDAEYEIKRSLMEDRPFKAVVIDLFLAGPQTGIDLWESAGESTRENMILTSGMAAEKFRRYFGDHHMAPPFLQKPYSFSACVETLRSMLGTEGETQEDQERGEYASGL